MGDARGRCGGRDHFNRAWEKWVGEPEPEKQLVPSPLLREIRRPGLAYHSAGGDEGVQRENSVRALTAPSIKTFVIHSPWCLVAIDPAATSIPQR